VNRLKPELLLKLVDNAEKGGGLRLCDELLGRIANFSRSEIFNIGCARSGGEADTLYVYYRTLDPRGNYKVEYLGMNGKGELELLNIYLKGKSEWIYLGSFVIRRNANECQVVNHSGLDDREAMQLIQKAVSILEEKLPVPAPINGTKSRLNQKSS